MPSHSRSSPRTERGHTGQGSDEGGKGGFFCLFVGDDTRKQQDNTEGGANSGGSSSSHNKPSGAQQRTRATPFPQAAVPLSTSTVNTQRGLGRRRTLHHVHDERTITVNTDGRLQTGWLEKEKKNLEDAARAASVFFSTTRQRRPVSLCRQQDARRTTDTDFLGTYSDDHQAQTGTSTRFDMNGFFFFSDDDRRSPHTENTR